MVLTILVLVAGALYTAMGLFFCVATVRSESRATVPNEPGDSFYVMVIWSAGRVLIGLALLLLPFTAWWVSIALVLLGTLGPRAVRRMSRRRHNARPTGYEEVSTIDS